MKLDAASRKEFASGAVMGGMGALVFLFAFPKGSISTLMHVLHMPGPVVACRPPVF